MHEETRPGDFHRNGLNIPDVSQLISDVSTLKTDMDKVKITL